MGGLEREPTRAQGAAPGFKVAVLGAAGGIGQPLSLLLKMNPLVSTLHLYDVFNTPGVTADLSTLTLLLWYAAHHVLCNFLAFLLHWIASKLLCVFPAYPGCL